MLRVGFTGTNWTGKTETIRRLLEIHKDASVAIVSLSDYVTKCPFPMKEKQTLDGSRWMVEQVCNAMDGPHVDLQIFDRTPLDILAFTLYAQRRAAACKPRLLQSILELTSQFDHVFYLKPSDQWPVNINVAPGQVRFARKMDYYIRKSLDQAPIPVIELPWDMRERCRVVSECLLNAPQLKG